MMRRLPSGLRRLRLDSCVLGANDLEPQCVSARVVTQCVLWCLRAVQRCYCVVACLFLCKRSVSCHEVCCPV
jgi:hypothetical protein